MGTEGPADMLDELKARYYAMDFPP